MAEAGVRFYVESSKTDAFASELAWKKGYHHVATEDWSTEGEGIDIPQLEELELMRSTSRLNDSFEAVYLGNGLLVRIDRRSLFKIRVYVYSLEYPAPIDVINQVRKIFPPAEEKDDPNVLNVNFWSNTNQGPQMLVRTVGIIQWKEYFANYPLPVAEQLGWLMKHDFDLETQGKLVLWTGMPGTGKTFALRALGDAWRGFASVDYVIDPEAFLGDPTYMMQVLMGKHEGRWNPKKEEYESQDNLARLLILEDTGELLSQDAKDRTGQGLARLLNSTDGLIGQGLKNIILITTNEEIGKLHPAVGRPGRCLSHVKFQKFDKEQANAWLETMGSEERVDHSMTLAELYARLLGNTNGGHSLASASASGEVGFKP
jgi:hypothetical protein